MSLADGVLTAVVWPTYVGATDVNGGEPRSDYLRGQIYWCTNEGGEILGRSTILVPEGWYTHLVYFHHPTSQLMVGRQKLSLPYHFRCPGVIEVEQISSDDFTQLPTPNGFTLPVANAHVQHRNGVGYLGEKGLR